MLIRYRVAYYLLYNPTRIELRKFLSGTLIFFNKSPDDVVPSDGSYTLLIIK